MDLSISLYILQYIFYSIIARLIVDLGQEVKGLEKYILNSFRKVVRSGITDPIDLSLLVAEKVAYRAAKKGLIINPEHYTGYRKNLRD